MIISGYSLDVLRNVSEHKYVERLTEKERHELRDLIVNAVSNLRFPFKYYPSYKLCDKAVDLYQESNLLSMNITSGSDPAILIDEEADLIAVINDIEHILISGRADGDVIGLLKKMTDIIKRVEELIPVQCDRVFGYKTSSLPLCGNGMIFDSLVHIPALMSQKRLPNIAYKLSKKTGAVFLPFNNNTSPSAFFVVRLISKENIYDDARFIKNAAEEISVMESSEVRNIKNNSEFLNKINYRYNLYEKSKRIGFRDFLQVLDVVVLKAKLEGIFIKSEDINDLLVSTQPEHLINSGVLEDDAEEFYYSKIFELVK